MKRTARTWTGAVLFLWACWIPPARAASPAIDPQPTSCTSAVEIDDLLARSASAYQRRDFTSGLALLQDAYDRSLKSNCAQQRAEALLRLSQNDTFLFKYVEAATKLNEAVEVFHRLNQSAREAEALVRLGNVLVLDDREAAGIPLLQRARELAVAMNDRALLLRAFNNLIYAVPEGEEKDRLRSDALGTARLAPDGRLTECQVMHEWGDELFSADRYADAFPKLTAAIQCFEGIGDRTRGGRAHVSLGRVYRAHGRLDAALEEYSRALAMQQEDADDPLATVQSLNAISVTLGYLGRHAEGLEWIQEAIRIARRLQSPRTVDFLLANSSQFYMARGRYADAAAALEETLSHPLQSYESIRLSDLSMAYMAMRRFDRALETAERGLATARGESEQLRALAARADALVAYKRFDAAADDLQRAVGMVDTLRAQTIPDDFLKRGFGQNYQWLFSSTIALLESQGRTREAIETAERARARALLDLLASRSRAPQGTDVAPLEASPASFADVVAAAKRAQSTVLAYWVSTTETFVWVVKADGTTASTRIPVTSAQLTDMIREATGSSGQGQIASVMLGAGSAGRPWRELYRTLVGPVRSHLPVKPGSRLTIVPHGPLFGLPFAALRDERGRYLVETYEVHYVPAVAALRAAPQPGDPRALSALLVGDPGPEAARDSLMPLPALPWADREVHAISALLPARATVLSGASATETNVRQQLAGRRLLHFATHGIVQNEERLASYLALRPSGDAPTATGQESIDATVDGKLTANETYGLHLDADLIVLSGCRTAAGPISGEGVIGFTRAFLAAGASSVVATMWDVADQPSFEMMKMFYSSWVAGAEKSRALRQAQLQMIRSLTAGKIRVNGVALPESPRFWAGYVLVGQP